MKRKGTKKGWDEKRRGQKTPQYGSGLHQTHLLIKQWPAVCQVPGSEPRLCGMRGRECLPRIWIYSPPFGGTLRTQHNVSNFHCTEKGDQTLPWGKLRRRGQEPTTAQL